MSHIKDKDIIITKCEKLLKAYKSGKLGDTKMPEDTHPTFKNKEDQLIYFTLPMALNYQRNSYKLWKSALKTYVDPKTSFAFSLRSAAQTPLDQLKNALIKHKLALQPNKQSQTWQTISCTIYTNWGAVTNLLKESEFDFLILKETIQEKFKKGFPYLSGPKIFNYWTYIIQEYGDIKLKNNKYISIAPDTHIIKASVRLGVISKIEANKLPREKIANRWFELLKDTEITPIEMHLPLWFWSRGGFQDLNL